MLKKTLVFSLVSHVTFFSIFSLSFGNRIQSADYARVNFWGQAAKIELRSPPDKIIRGIKGIFLNQPVNPRLEFAAKETPLKGYYLKPLSPLSFNTRKQSLARKQEKPFSPARRHEPSIVFHPLLPYDFALYFKDRQVAHVELMFNMARSGGKILPIIKRKISSGNLEVDLLSIRYIGRYLFIQEADFAPNSWRTVKIDLSAKDD